MKKVRKVQSLMMSLGAVDYAKKQARYFFNKGVKDAPTNQPTKNRWIGVID